MKKNNEALQVSVDARFRQYRYTATLTPTGKLKYIRAGCREWTTFHQAYLHYRGEGPHNAVKWHDEYISKEFRGSSSLTADCWRAAMHFAERWDARKCLILLEQQVDALQERIARQRKRATAVKKRHAQIARQRKKATAAKKRHAQR